MAIDVSIGSFYINRKTETGSNSYVFSGTSNAVPLAINSINVNGSVNDLYDKHYTQDASIILYVNKNLSQDTSLNYLFLWRNIHEPSIGRIDVSIRNILVGDTTFGGSKIFTNLIVTPSTRSSNFIAGTLGRGYQAASNAQFENLIVTGNLDVITLTNKIFTATNGTLIVNPSVTAVDTSTELAGINKDSSGYYFNVDPWRNSMRSGYYIKSQNQSATGISKLEFRVIDVKAGKIYINFPSPDQSTFYNDINVANGNLGSFTDTGPYYQGTPNGTPQYAQTPLRNVKDGSLYVAAQAFLMGAPGPTCTIALYDGAGALYDTIATGVTTGLQTKTILVPLDVSLRIRFTFVNSSGTPWGMYKPDMINYYTIDSSIPNVKGREFVRVDGNPIIISSDMENNPYSRYYVDVSGLVPTNENLVLAEGNLEGTRFNDVSLSGFGIMTTNFYGKGTLEMTSGKIGGLSLNNNILKSNDSSFYYELSPNDLIFYDTSDGFQTILSSEKNPNVENLVNGLTLSYTGNGASQYTLHNFTSSSSDVFTDVSVFIGNRATTNTTLTKMSTAPADASCLDTVSGVRYLFEMGSIITYSITIPENYTSNPGPYQTVHEFSQSGSYNINDSVVLFNGADVSIKAFSGNETGITENTHYYFIEGGYFNMNSAFLYLKDRIRIYNNFQIKEVVTQYLGGVVYRVDTYYTNTDVAFTWKVWQLKIRGEQKYVQLAPNGLNIINTTDKFFSFNSDLTTPLRVKGNEYHECVLFDCSVASRLNIRKGGNSAIPLMNGALSVANNEATEFAAAFYSDGNNSNRYGIKIQAGEDTPAGTNYYIRFYDGDGNDIGAVYKTGGGALTLGTPSDTKLKTNIVDASIQALDLITKLRVANFKMKKSSGIPVNGFIADEAELVYPNMVLTTPEGTKMVGMTELIPVHHKAIQELNAAIEELKKPKQNAILSTVRGWFKK